MLPGILIRFGGAAVCVTLVLLWMKGDIYKELSWWVVLLPVIIAVSVFLLVFTAAIFAWIYLAILLVTGNVEVDVDREVRLDVLFRTAKVCFLGHGYIQLLALALGLLLLKLSIWPNLPVVYPMLPLIVLGFIYVFLAVMFKQPEVDSTWYSIVGMSLLSQSIMLVIKLDQFYESDGLPWAATFTPAWLTYALLLVYCVTSPIQAYTEGAADEGSRTALSTAASSEAPYGSVQRERSGSGHNSARLQTQLQKVAGIGGWVIGCGLSQVFLTMRLDGLYKMSWLGILLPALLGCILLIVFDSELVSKYFRDILEMLLDTLGVICVKDQEYVSSHASDAMLEAGAPDPWK